MSKLAIFDKDGTLVRPKSGGTFPQHPEDQELIPGVAEAIQDCVADGWTIAIASNQGGVVAGYKTLESAIAEMRYCLSLLPSEAKIEGAYFCPDNGQTCYRVSAPIHYEDVPNRPHAEITPVIAVHDQAIAKIMNLNGLYRKPNPGMLLYATRDRGSAVPRIFVGDRPEDEQAAANADIPFVWAHDWRKPL